MSLIVAQSDSWLRISSFRSFARDIKISHSIFALPFAASALILVPLDFPNFSQIMLLLIAMVSARSFSMGVNRLADRNFDLENRRTKSRALPSGELSVSQGLFWTLLSGSLLIAAAFALNWRAGLASIPLLLVLAGYSFMKRFSWWCHYYLGGCLGLAPIAVVVALNQSVTIELVLLSIAITLWTAGFDIIYALQDIDFDIKTGLKSVPSRFGVKKALMISRLSFAAMVIALGYLGTTIGASVIYLASLSFIAGILIWEHWQVRNFSTLQNSAGVKTVFFNGNAMVSVCYLIGLILDQFFRRFSV